jgi:hypothetical protein
LNKFSSPLICGISTAFLAIIVGHPASADPMPIFNTGLSDSGLALPVPGEQDTHWLIGGVPSLTAVDPYSGWIANRSNGPVQSGWIGSFGAPGIVYTYTQSFLIPAGATNLSLSGEWAVDDQGALFLNDYEILSARHMPTMGSLPWKVFKTFTLDDSTKFLPGSTNTLKAVITNSGGPYGFQAQFQGSYTPVPGPLPVFGVAAAFACSRRLRQRIGGK